MADVKWIKITTDIFDDEKIKIIDTMPARDEILVIWFKLLSLAGRTNQGGALRMNSKIPYTNEMLAAVFNRNLNMVKLSLNIFQNYGMIEVEENETISIVNWDKHQNIEGLDKIRIQNKNRQQIARDKKKQLQIDDNHVTDNVTVTQDNATELEKELELDKELDKDRDKKKTTTTKQGFDLIINNYTLNLDLKNTIINFIKMRKAIKKTLTDNALELILKKLNNLTTSDNEKIEILSNSIMGSWQGVFPLKGDKDGGIRKNNGTGKNQNNSESEGDRLSRRAAEKYGSNVENIKCDF